MPDTARRLPARASLEQLQKQAKELLRLHRKGDAGAEERFRPAHDRTLADAQFVIAREYGFESWAQLKQHVEARRETDASRYEALANDLMSAVDGEAEALARLNAVFGNTFTRAGTPFTAGQLRERVGELLPGVEQLTLDSARLFIARQHGFADWAGLLPGTSSSAAHGRYQIDWRENTIRVGPVSSSADWDTICAVMKEHRITGLDAGGRMTDAGLRRLSKLGHITRLNLGGSAQLSDNGLAHLAGLDALRELDLSGVKGQVTDRGLEVLRRLPALRRFEACWQPNLSDAGFAHLAACEHLESVNLLGTAGGDGAIQALNAKAKLRDFRSGRTVTDAGLGLFREFPAFRTWEGRQVSYGLMSAKAGPTHLLIDGPFTKTGLDGLATLDGLFGLTFFWHCSAITGADLGPLKDFANLGFIGCQDALCDDAAMRHIASIPKLRMLMAQGTVATEAGFAELSRSRTLEYIWGRECCNLTGRGFAAFAEMPALRGIAVSCKRVEDDALALLPRFGGLRELVPMDVADDGFRHVGRCEKLEALWCMYCRETGDQATTHIADLSNLKTYYAGKTRITDRTLEILGRMESLEKLEFWQCAGLTNNGLAHVAGLPRLREIGLDGLAGVSREAISLFPASVRVSYTA